MQRVAQSVCAASVACTPMSMSLRMHTLARADMQGDFPSLLIHAPTAWASHLCHIYRLSFHTPARCIAFLFSFHVACLTEAKLKGVGSCGLPSTLHPLCMGRSPTYACICTYSSRAAVTALCRRWQHACMHGYAFGV